VNCRFIKNLAVILGSTCLLLAGGIAHGAGILIVASENTAPYREVIEKIISVTHQAGNLRIDEIPVTSLAQKRRELSGGGYQLAVTVGVRATESLAALNLSTPILGTLIPGQAYEDIARRQGLSDYHRFSAVFLDQPLARRFELLRAALPGSRQVGVVLGPVTQPELGTLVSTAREHGLTIHAEKISTPDQLIPALQKVSGETDVFFALPDPMVVSRDTAQSLLLTTYRANIPVIAFSHAYVNAGALAAVYSTPEQIGQQTGEIILQSSRSGDWNLTKPQYPKYFSVSVNSQVARSLGLEIESDQVLAEKLKSSMEREP
jgi:putative ABC transport system substrate-binding protein